MTILRLIIPTSVSIIPDPDEPRGPFLTAIVLDVLIAVLQAAAFLLAGTTQRCAPEGKYVAPIKIEAALLGGEAAPIGEKQILRPVSAITSSSPIAYLFFNWLTPVLQHGATVESLSEDDLPLLGANDRAPNLFDAIKKEEGIKGPSWANRLLWQVLIVNKRLFAWRKSSRFARE